MAQALDGKIVVKGFANHYEAMIYLNTSDEVLRVISVTTIQSEDHTHCEAVFTVSDIYYQNLCQQLYVKMVDSAYDSCMHTIDYNMRQIECMSSKLRKDPVLSETMTRGLECMKILQHSDRLKTIIPPPAPGALPTKTLNIQLDNKYLSNLITRHWSSSFNIVWEKEFRTRS